MSADFIKRQFVDYGVKNIIPHDEHYYALTEKNLRAFVFKYHTPMAYYKSEVFDCDKFSITCFADIIKGSVMEHFPLAAAFGTVTVARRAYGDRHMLNWGMTARGDILLYEPQIENPDKNWMITWPDYELQEIEI